MRLHTTTTLLVMILLGGCVNLAEQPANIAPENFTALFNGKNFDGWRGRKADLNPEDEAKLSKDELAALQAQWNADRDQHWTIDATKGEIASDGKGVFIATNKDYGDFELYVDWMLANPHADSGIYLRGYPQVQIWDPDFPIEFAKGSQKGSGGLYNNSIDSPGHFPLVRADNPIGQWNTYHIKMIGSRVWVWLNGKLTVDGQILENNFDRTKPLVTRGPLALQSHAGVVKFRNIYIREINPEEANKTPGK